jgi:membrane fusion protein (multidrug efflux system)
VKPSAVIATTLIVITLAGIGSGLYTWKMGSFAEAANSPQYEPSESVVAIPVGTITWQPTADLVGTALATRSVTLGAEMSGTVKEVNFESGALVEAGQVLVTLDSTTERADLEAAQASIPVAEADVKAAESALQWSTSTLTRLEQAIASGATSKADLDDARSRVDAATASLQRAQAAVVEARARVDQIEAIISRKTLRSPFRAVAGLRNVHSGQYMPEGATIVMLQEAADDIFVDFALPQQHIARIKVGDSVMATSSVFGNEPRKIEVVAIDAAANPVTRNVRIRSKVDNRDKRLRPGMFVDVRVPVGPAQEFVAIPNTSIRRASYGDHVFVVNEVPSKADPGKAELRASQRFIKLGPSVGTDLIVLDGLKVGEQVASTGSFKLREGVLVTIAPPLAASDKAPPPAEPGASGG